MQADLEMMGKNKQTKKKTNKQGYQYWQSNRHKVHTEKNTKNNEQIW